jgi:hypothetical protein
VVNLYVEADPCQIGLDDVLLLGAGEGVAGVEHGGLAMCVCLVDESPGGGEV